MMPILYECDRDLEERWADVVRRDGFAIRRSPDGFEATLLASDKAFRIRLWKLHEKLEIDLIGLPETVEGRVACSLLASGAICNIKNWIQWDALYRCPPGTITRWLARQKEAGYVPEMATGGIRVASEQFPSGVFSSSSGGRVEFATGPAFDPVRREQCEYVCLSIAAPRMLHWHKDRDRNRIFLIELGESLVGLGAVPVAGRRG